MNNQTKILLNIQGISGSTLRRVGVKDIPYKKLITKGDKDILVTKKRKVSDIETVPCQQNIKLTVEAYEYMVSAEKPSWSKSHWKKMTRTQRLEEHLKRYCEDRGGTSFTYSILEE